MYLSLQKVRQGLRLNEFSGCARYFKGRFEVAKYGRNLGGLTVSIREDHIGRRVTEILARMKEILYVGVRD
jgi:hypothetical protein